MQNIIIKKTKKKIANPSKCFTSPSFKGHDCLHKISSNSCMQQLSNHFSKINNNRKKQKVINGYPIVFEIFQSGPKCGPKNRFPIPLSCPVFGVQKEATVFTNINAAHIHFNVCQNYSFNSKIKHSVIYIQETQSPLFIHIWMA